MFKSISLTFTFLLLLFSSLNSKAATLPNATVTPADTTAGVTTSYTVQFDAVTAMNDTYFIRFKTNVGGANMSNATIVSSSFGSPGITISKSATQLYINLSSGSSVGSGGTVTMVFDNIINPSSDGLGPNYNIDVECCGSYSAIDSAIVTGTNYTPNIGPVVSNAIPNQNIDQEDGAITVDLDSSAAVNTDLDYTFTDGGGATMTFTIEAGYDTSVVTASVNGSDELILTGTGTGNTDVTVRATSTNGTITDTLNVSVVGDLAPASVTPDSLVAGANTNYVVTLDPATVLNSGDFIILTNGTDLTNKPDHSSSTLVSLSGGLSGTRSAGSTNHTVIWLDGGTANPGSTITVTLGNIVNPGSTGSGAEYIITTTDGGTTGRSTVAGNTFTGAGAPTVANLIPDQNFNEEDGPITVDLDSGMAVITDLDFTFFDSDGDPMTYTIVAGHDTSVVNVSIVSDEIILTGVSTGSTLVTVQAQSVDGTVTDSFNVTVLGDLPGASVVADTLDAGAFTTYTVSFSPDSGLMAGDFIFFNSPVEIDQSASTFDSLTGGTIAGSRTLVNATTSRIQLSSGIADSLDTITIVLGNVHNNASNGTMVGDFTINITDGSSSIGFSTVAGSTLVPVELMNFSVE